MLSPTRPTVFSFSHFRSEMIISIFGFGDAQIIAGLAKYSHQQLFQCFSPCTRSLVGDGVYAQPPKIRPFAIAVNIHGPFLPSPAKVWHGVLRAAESKPAADGARREDGPASANGKSGDGAAGAGADGIAALEVGADAEGEDEPEPAAEGESAGAESKPVQLSLPLSSALKGRQNGPKCKAVVESEDEGKQRTAGGTGDEADSPIMVDPAALRVREWRHKLQKAFLNTKATPKEDDMPQLDQLFTLVETYDNMRIEYLTFSKIGKVMRHIHALGDDKVPRDGEFRFRARAGVLVDRWLDVLRTAGSRPAAAGARKEDGPASPSGRSEDGAMETVLRAADGAPESTPAAGGARTEDGPASTNGKLGVGATESKADAAAVEVDAGADAKGETGPTAEEESAGVESGPAPALVKINT
ncbi:hypothetical protein VTO73DRAFT_1594 [Trametes versicolor]